MAPETAGKFNVLEGIEGCGKGTQTKLLSDFLIQKGLTVVAKKYPEYGQPIGDLINNWLHKKYELNAETQALLYFADFIKDKDFLKNGLENGTMWVVDRYFTSTMVYQHINGIPLENLLKLSELFNLPKPDLCIYIKISPETSYARKLEQKGLTSMDRHEEDKKFLSALYDNFEKMSKKKIFCDWETIDGEKPIGQVFAQITDLLNKKFKI